MKHYSIDMHIACIYNQIASVLEVNFALWNSASDTRHKS